MKIKKYKVGMDSEVMAISLVEVPAIEENYVYLAKQTPKSICLEKNEKHLVIGAVLIPNRPIYRYDEDWGEYYIEFGADIIEKLSYDFMKKSNNQSVTLDHLTDAKNISVVESWIKTSENDKSVGLGFDLPIGTWFASMKVEDEETWNRVKNEELNGFSIESFVSLEELKLSKISKDNMDKEMLESVEVNDSFWDKLKSIIADALGGDKETAEEVVEEAKEEVVEEEPKEEEMEEETPTAEEPQGEELVEEVVEEVVAVVEEASEEPKDDLQAIVDELQAKVDALVAENEELKKTNEKLSKQPSVNKVNVEASKQDGGLTSKGQEFLNALYNGKLHI